MEQKYETAAFEIIANVGEAKSYAVEAINMAKDKKSKNEIEEMLEKARESFAIASHAHFDLISEEAQGHKLELPLLLVHAEDQLLTTDLLIMLAENFIEIYEKI